MNTEIKSSKHHKYFGLYLVSNCLKRDYLRFTYLQKKFELSFQFFIYTTVLEHKILTYLDQIMDSMYELLPIEGKGLGCVATKEIKIGTLILEEIPQLVVPQNIVKKSELSLEFMCSLVDTFKKMSKTDQEEFLNLYNR